MHRQDFMKSNNEIDYVAYASYLESERNQLIEYLENKINELEEKINIFYETYIDKNCTILEAKLETYQDTLERVKSGKYD